MKLFSWALASAIALSGFTAAETTAAASEFPNCPDFAKVVEDDRSVEETRWWRAFIGEGHTLAPVAPGYWAVSDLRLVDNRPFPGGSTYNGPRVGDQYQNFGVTCTYGDATQYTAYYSLPVFGHGAWSREPQLRSCGDMVVLGRSAKLDSRVFSTKDTYDYSVELQAELSLEAGGSLMEKDLAGLEAKLGFKVSAKVMVSGSEEVDPPAGKQIRVDVYRRVHRCYFNTVEEAPNGARLVIDVGYADRLYPSPEIEQTVID